MEIIYTRVPNPRFAYTYKDTHPIWCSLIGDMPLFYRSSPSSEWDEGEYETDDDEKDPVLLQLERDIADLRAKSSRAKERLPERVHSWDLVKQNSFDGSVLWQPQDLLDLLGSVGIGRQLIRDIDQVITGPAITAEFIDGTLIVNNHRDLYQVAFATIRALRVTRNKPSNHQIDHAIFYYRLIEADSLCWMFRWAWEKLLTGNTYPMEMYRAAYPDLALAGTREAMDDFRSLRDGRCSKEVAEVWFLNEYCRAIDTRTIQRVLADYSKASFDEELTISGALAITELKGEVNYLSKTIRLMMVDPTFTEVRRRQDANFVWFLKFEKSFAKDETPPEHTNCRTSQEHLRVISDVTGETDGSI